jgi:hypothetical protein
MVLQQHVSYVKRDTPSIFDTLITMMFISTPQLKDGRKYLHNLIDPDDA